MSSAEPCLSPTAPTKGRDQSVGPVTRSSCTEQPRPPPRGGPCEPLTGTKHHRESAPTANHITTAGDLGHRFGGQRNALAHLRCVLRRTGPGRRHRFVGRPAAARAGVGLPMTDS